MSETRGEGPRPPISLRGKVVRALAGLGLAFSIGAGTEAATGGAVSKIPGNVVQAGKEVGKTVLNTAGDLVVNSDPSRAETEQFSQNIKDRKAAEQRLTEKAKEAQQERQTFGEKPPSN